ncbi:hypothetical protein J437_LFUL015024 [Ladona fulva]|uniref:Beta-1,4-glucuronyltransferase 1 n=1 Tax=Ladona fulva TaxID=123851 RepID=A0A8K0KIL8_LADFU|nr:hypothetical protein J437_LFUL015024 [Ladona fulva]
MILKVIPFAFVGPGWSSAANLSVCIATHSSVNRMQSLAELLLSWKAAASVAVFVSGPDVQIVQLFLGYLQFCYPEALLRVSIHLIHSVERPPVESSLPVGKKYDCKVHPEKFLEELSPDIGMSMEGKNETETVYPQNILRNSAIRMCPTEWIMTVDVDMLPPPSLHRRLENFFAQKENGNCSKCAFALPTYEVKPPNGLATPLEMAETLPNTKEDLLRLIKKKSARPFHIKIFKKNQETSKLSRWEKLPRLPNDDIHVAYVVNYSFWYEPVFVAKRGFPPFDERFLGFGMTRNTQAYEMFLAGYQFKLLDNAFLVHWGFQEMKRRPAWRLKQTAANYNLFKNWLLEKTIRYDSDPLNLTHKIVKNQEKRRFRVTMDKKEG